MRLPERLLALITLAAAATAAQADPIDLQPFRASFTAQWKGISAATSTLELRKAGADTYTFATVNTPHGLFRMALPDSLMQVSTFKVIDGRVVPLNFRGSDEKERPIDLTFDWGGKRVTGTAKDHAIDITIPEDAQDPMSLQIASLRDLAKGTIPATVSLVDGDGKLKEYELRQEGTARLDTALGALDTIVYTSRRKNSERVTRTWVAPALGYLPVKAERVRGKKAEFTLLIDSVDK
jgi:Protein of unknown function (DUF3108)